ncbi:EscU/YscU/HrcU family type III secretion system export apparatus switch protein [Sphingomonas sp. DT-204]|uniref:EscU/YscU/HrcU family type III secretion system export apparatus switch protein n=1 Tax=Sphingomonas sp. DT-204 TaxID=3396166 RepID=UPI003F1B1810
MAEEQEQNRTEEATPFKLKQAREKGMVARGLDLGFVAGLIGLAAFVALAGIRLVELLAQAMRRALTLGVQSAADPQAAAAMTGQLLAPLLGPLALFGGTLLAVILLVEIVQLRGLSFSTTPLKPDFSRINPVKGLKRLLSIRMLKEAFKAILKMAVYATVAVLTIRAAVEGGIGRTADAMQLSSALQGASMRLLLVFIAVAAGLAVLDQILARGEFRKQMRMSRRELTREVKEREGDPRLRSKRKQLHAAFVRQARGLGNLPGSDLVIVNPRHLAVALAYRANEMTAPEVTAKGADRHALQIRAAARRLGIPIFEAPLLARALFRETDMGQAIAPAHYHAVAGLYHKLRDAGNA